LLTNCHSAGIEKRSLGPHPCAKDRRRSMWIRILGAMTVLALVAGLLDGQEKRA
jgi:hypothetical protein